ncbi:DUF1097 domain-containing protein [Shigella flexneri]
MASWAVRPTSACPQGGLKGLAISAATPASGVVWAMVILTVVHWHHIWKCLGYVITGIVPFLMCIQAKQLLLSFVPGTFIGACATLPGRVTRNWCYLRWRLGWYLVTQ